MSAFTFRMNRKGGEEYDSDDESGPEPSTAAPSGSSQVSGVTQSAFTTGGDSQTKPFEKTVSDALTFHFSGLETAAAKSLGKKDRVMPHAMARDSKVLEKAEKLLQARNQVPLQGKEFHRYIVHHNRTWFYRVYHRSEDFVGLCIWRTSPELLVQDLKDECRKSSNQGVVAAQLTCIWHRLEKMKTEDWTSWESHQEFYTKHFPESIVDHKEEGSPYRGKRQRISQESESE